VVAEQNRISWTTLSSGLQVPSRDGRFLCSQRDPQREAQNWMDMHRQFCTFGDVIVVMGLGAGFHLDLLLKEFSTLRVDVIELCPVLIESWTEKNPDAKDRVNFLSSSDLSEFELVKQKMPVILDYRPAQWGLEGQYQRIFEFLLGGDVSIKNIAQDLSVNDQSLDAKTWRALEELVQ